MRPRSSGVMSIVRRAVNALPAAMPVGCGSVALIHVSGLPGRDDKPAFVGAFRRCRASTMERQ